MDCYWEKLIMSKLMGKMQKKNKKKDFSMHTYMTSMKFEICFIFFPLCTDEPYHRNKDRRMWVTLYNPVGRGIKKDLSEENWPPSKNYTAIGQHRSYHKVH